MSDEIITKQCSRCKEIKQASEYYKDKNRKDGLYCWCKTCKRDCCQSPAGKASQKKSNTRRYQANREKVRKYNAEYDRTPKGRASQRKRAAKHRLKNPNQNKAGNKVKIAVRGGILPSVKTMKCRECPNQAKEYHHYLGYDEVHWLDVIPLCIPCHIATHQENQT